jgi:hypothetical protein
MAPSSAQWRRLAFFARGIIDKSMPAYTELENSTNPWVKGLRGKELLLASNASQAKGSGHHDIARWLLVVSR